MKRLLAFILIFLLAVWLGVHVAKDPGYALFAYQHWTVEMPLWIACVLFILSIWIIHQILVLWRGTRHLASRIKLFSKRRHTEQSSRYTKRGLTALTEGKWAVAEKALLRGVKYNEHPLVNYLAAARAAQEQHADDRRDHYLQLAHQTAPGEKMAVGLTQAQLQLGYEQLEQSLATLKQLQHLAPKNSEVLKLLKDLYLKLADWSALVEILPEIKKNKVLTDEALLDLEVQAYQGFFQQLAKQQNLSALEEAWQQCPKHLRKNSTLVGIFATLLIQLSASTQAEQLLRETLKHTWDLNLVNLYGELESNDPSRQIETLEHLLKIHGASATLTLSLGRLYRRQQVWGQAKRYLTQSIELKPSQNAYTEQGLLFEALKEPNLAYESFKAGAMLRDI